MWPIFSVRYEDGYLVYLLVINMKKKYPLYWKAVSILVLKFIYFFNCIVPTINIKFGDRQFCKMVCLIIFSVLLHDHRNVQQNTDVGEDGIGLPASAYLVYVPYIFCWKLYWEVADFKVDYNRTCLSWLRFSASTTCMGYLIYREFTWNLITLILTYEFNT